MIHNGYNEGIRFDWMKDYELDGNVDYE